MLERLFLQLFTQHWEEVMKFETVRSREPSHQIVIDFRVINIHTGWYVGGTQSSDA
jgi:hypothetical protein